MKNRALRIFFLSLDFVLPPDRGLRVRTLTQLQLLDSIEAIELVRVASLRDVVPVPPEKLAELEAMLPKVKVDPPIPQPVHLRKHPRAIPRVLRKRTLGRMPYIVAKCDNASLRALVRRRLREERFDVIYIGALGMMPYVKDARELQPLARIVLEQHNVEWEIWERLAPSLKQPFRTIARIEAYATRRFEARAMREVDAVIAISSPDARAFRALAGRDAIVVPTFIEPKAPRSETTSKPALAYVGQLAWQPNALGLDWFCEEVWPLVRARLPEATLSIAGGGLPKDAAGKPTLPPLWRKPGVTALGFVDDLESVYRETLALVAPIRGGSGVRMKLLESMSAGMPSVTTTDGALGLDVEDGRELLIADDAPGFADRVVRVLSDARLRATLRDASADYLRAHHSAAAGRARMLEALGVTTGVAP